MPLKRLNCTLSPAINVLKWDRINFWAYWVALWGQSAIGVSPCAIKLCRSPAQVMIQALARKEPSSASFTEYKSLLCQFWPFIWPQMMFRVTTTGPKVILKFQDFADWSAGPRIELWPTMRHHGRVLPRNPVNWLLLPMSIAWWHQNWQNPHRFQAPSIFKISASNRRKPVGWRR